MPQEEWDFFKQFFMIKNIINFVSLIFVGVTIKDFGIDESALKVNISYTFVFHLKIIIFTDVVQLGFDLRLFGHDCCNTL